jgi:tetratricopeptide (TPR) repeat protein
MAKDCRGLEMTAADQTSVDCFDATLTGFLGFTRDVGDRLKATFAADPDMPMAHVLRGYFMLLFANPVLNAKAAQSLDAAQEGAEVREASARERAHVAALEAWCAGDMRRATDLWEDILLDAPRDMLALKIGHYTHFYLGDSAELRDSVARVLPAWDADTPDHGFLLAMRAFGLEETGAYAAAEDAGRAAVEINPADIWGVHAVAHVMEMQGRLREGVDWIAGLEADWDTANNFRFHVWWHRALFHFALGDQATALALYDDRIRADRTDDVLDFSNAASLLWRLEADGVAVGDRWEELADIAVRRGDDQQLAFADVHYVMALAGAGRLDGADGLAAAIAGVTDEGRATEAPILRRVAAPLAHGLIAFRRGDAARAVALMLPIRHEIRAIGGSHAQRDVFARTLVDAALAADQPALARALVAERLAANPNSPWSWRRMARAQETLGDATAAAQAQARVEALLAA